MIKLFNSLTNTKEEFVPIDKNEVKIYSCGPTVYYYAHIGNMFAYIFMDELVKTLKFNGYKVKNVMNITDVGHLTSDEDDGDDKMEMSALKEGKTVLEIAKFYTDFFFDSLNKIGVAKPTIIAKATEHIPEMIEFIKVLQNKGFTYTISDGVYFDVSKFPNYGCLSGKKLDDLKAGARVKINEEKRNAYDFALWKFVDKSHIMKWESPFGVGCPGWHIECSAMSRKYLGDTFDIHTGGIDHKPIHHENEIAQSEGMTGKKQANTFMHCEFIKVDGGKMSKSLGNIYTIPDLEKRGFDGLDYRYLCLTAHYQKGFNFTFEALEGAKQARLRLYDTLAEHYEAIETKTAKAVLDKYLKDFTEAINDNLNIAKALGIVWTMLKTEKKSKDLFKLSVKFDEMLSLNIKDNVAKVINEKNSSNYEIPKEILDLAKKRLEAKKEKNFTLSDQLRTQILNAGYIIKDTVNGYELTKIN